MYVPGDSVPRCRACMPSAALTHSTPSVWTGCGVLCSRGRAQGRAQGRAFFCLAFFLSFAVSPSDCVGACARCARHLHGWGLYECTVLCTYQVPPNCRLPCRSGPTRQVDGWVARKSTCAEEAAAVGLSFLSCWCELQVSKVSVYCVCVCVWHSVKNVVHSEAPDRLPAMEGTLFGSDGRRRWLPFLPSNMASSLRGVKVLGPNGSSRAQALRHPLSFIHFSLAPCAAPMTRSVSRSR